MKKYNFISIFILLSFLFIKCTKFLQEQPTKDGEIPTKVSQLQTFYNNNHALDMCNYRSFISDDLSIPWTKEDVDQSVGSISKKIDYMYSPYFRRDLRRRNGLSGDAWSSLYGRINKDNYVLSLVDKLSGTTKEKEIVKSYAKFSRAEAMFDLVTTYGLPYSPGENDGDLGIVLIESYSLNQDFESLKRSTLKETYDYIERELLESMENIPNDDVVWKTTKKSVYGFAARFYLMLGKYDKAEMYADLALAIKNTLVDYTSFTTIPFRTNNGGVLPVLPYFSQVTFVDAATFFKLEEMYSPKRLQTSTNPVFISQDLIDLYVNDGGVNDIRFFNIPEEGGVVYTGYMPITSTAKYRSYTGYGPGNMLSSPDVPEMVLIKAECLAEKGNLTEAKTYLNMLRIKRIKNYNPASVNNISNRDDLLDFIYDERRRERPFIWRGLDIRRLNAIKKKNIVISKRFFEITNTEVLSTQPKIYTLNPDSKEYADYLSDEEIALSNGNLQQNP